MGKYCIARQESRQISGRPDKHESRKTKKPADFLFLTFHDDLNVKSKKYNLSNKTEIKDCGPKIEKQHFYSFDSCPTTKALSCWTLICQLKQPLVNTTVQLFILTGCHC